MKMKPDDSAKAVEGAQRPQVQFLVIGAVALEASLAVQFSGLVDPETPRMSSLPSFPRGFRQPRPACPPDLATRRPCLPSSPPSPGPAASPRTFPRTCHPHPAGPGPLRSRHPEPPSSGMQLMPYTGWVPALAW